MQSVLKLLFYAQQPAGCYWMIGWLSQLQTESGKGYVSHYMRFKALVAAKVGCLGFSVTVS